MRVTDRLQAVADLAADMLRAIAAYSKTDRAAFFKTVDEAQDAKEQSSLSEEIRKREESGTKSCRLADGGEPINGKRTLHTTGIRFPIAALGQRYKLEFEVNFSIIS
jgi:hypothetical protein